MKISVILLALLLAAMAMVPMVSAQEKILQPVSKGDLVDKANLSAMTPPLLLKLGSQGFSEEKIAQYLLTMESSRQEGWTDEDNEKAISYLKKIPPD